jgi:hypothetical protein
MAIYRRKCRAGKPDDAAHLHREMQIPSSNMPPVASPGR